MEATNLSPISPYDRWQVASSGCPTVLNKNTAKAAGIFASVVLVTAGALTGCVFLCIHAVKIHNDGMFVGGILAGLATGAFVGGGGLGGANIFCSHHFDWNAYHKPEVARKISKELLTLTIEQLALERFEQLPKKYNRDACEVEYIDLDGYEKNGIIGPDEKASLLAFRKEYRTAKEKMEKEDPSLANDAQHLFDDMSMRLKKYQEGILPAHLPFQ